MTEYLMSRREYESALKDLLEELAWVVWDNEPEYLKTVYMPQNVAGSKRLSVDEWLDAREEKSQRGEG